jgi:uncharacterized Ntn-hydrolase superfamily protein
MKRSSSLTRFCLILLISGLTLGKLFAQDTFSIVAIDSVNGLFGSAGASCVGSSSSYPHGAQILSDVIPGTGVIHTQAAWTSANQQNAHNWMMMGLAPQQIIDSLVANDAGGNPSTRQYGIVDYNSGHPRSAAFTGVNCSDYKNDTAHLNYSIQGNILMGQKILDSMQVRFLNSVGFLGDRLMAALQGAKVVGADTRCAVRGTSSQSAFIRVGRMTDAADSLYCDLWMAYPTNYSGQFPVDPIDSLQTLYDLWKTTTSVTGAKSSPPSEVKIYRGEGENLVFDFSHCRNYLQSGLQIFDITGRCLRQVIVTSRFMTVNIPDAGRSRILLYRLSGTDGAFICSGKFLR